jgi:hypothetical protein
MPFVGQGSIRSKIITDNTMLEQVNAFTYLEYKLSYDEEKDIALKINKFLHSLGILKNVLKPNLDQRQS